MGLKEIEGLRSFCNELSSDQPSPGGGTASAAAGAMAASLLIMVCGVSSRSKKLQDHWRELESLRTVLVKRRDDLIHLAKADAESYDALVEASRKRRAGDSEETRMGYQKALRAASEVPARTAAECTALLTQAISVASIQTKSAASDTKVAVLLAQAGFEGASANVEINLMDIEDEDFVRTMRERLRVEGERAKRLAGEAFSRLG